MCQAQDTVCHASSVCAYCVSLLCKQPIIMSFRASPSYVPKSNRVCSVSFPLPSLPASQQLSKPAAYPSNPSRFTGGHTRQYCLCVCLPVYLGLRSGIWRDTLCIRWVFLCWLLLSGCHHMAGCLCRVHKGWILALHGEHFLPHMTAVSATAGTTCDAFQQKLLGCICR